MTSWRCSRELYTLIHARSTLPDQPIILHIISHTMQEKPQLKRVVIAGPTASGKSALSLCLARMMGCPIISADARQCYRYMDIGTAKVSPKERRKIPHYNISIFDPDQTDNARDFADRCRQWESEISTAHDTVIYVGGSTLYLESILMPLDDLPAANRENLQTLEQWEHRYGLAYLFRLLREKDLQYASTIDAANRHRIFRALDVWMQTGRPFSSFHRSEQRTLPASTQVYTLHHERAVLHRRINRRVEQMVEHGLVEEVRRLLDMGYTTDLQSMKSVGYREATDYLQDNIDLNTMIQRIATRTRQYAKRQITWFRRWPFTQWLDAGDHTHDELIQRIHNDVSLLDAEYHKP